jgi:hypothetical protein
LKLAAEFITGQYPGPKWVYDAEPDALTVICRGERVDVYTEYEEIPLGLVYANEPTPVELPDTVQMWLLSALTEEADLVIEMNVACPKALSPPNRMQKPTASRNRCSLIWFMVLSLHAPTRDGVEAY